MKINNIFLILFIFIISFSGFVLWQDNIKYINDKNSVEEGNSILLVGDIMIARNTEDDPFKYVTNLISSTISSGNLEFVITKRTTPQENRRITLKETCQKSQIIKNIGFDYVSIANNHILDYGELGLYDTISCLSGMNISFNGAGKNLKDANNLSIFVVNNTTIGLLSFSTDHQLTAKEKFANEEQYGIFYVNFDVIKNAKKKVNILIINIHWGKELVFDVSEFQRKTGRKMIDSGADLIIGSHPHVKQPYEKYNGKYIFYSLGNFVFDQEHEATKNSMAIRLFFDNKNISKIEVINLRISNIKPFIENIEIIENK